MIDANYLHSLPKKRMGSGAIIINQNHELIIVKPTYKQDCSLPGGVIDSNESPKQACQREIKEELGLDIKLLKLLCVDYRSYPETNDESLQFIFLAEIITKDQIEKIILPKDEISEFKFIKFDEIKNINFSRGIKNRIQYGIKAIDNDSCYYLENGEE